MSELSLIVRMTAKPGRAVALEDALRAVVVPTHAEAGCLRFALHRSAGDPSVFLLVEHWSSKQALEEHLAKPYLKTLFAKLPELAEPSEVAEYQMLAAGDPGKLL